MNIQDTFANCGNDEEDAYEYDDGDFDDIMQNPFTPQSNHPLNLQSDESSVDIHTKYRIWQKAEVVSDVSFFNFILFYSYCCFQ